MMISIEINNTKLSVVENKEEFESVYKYLTSKGIGLVYHVGISDNSPNIYPRYVSISDNKWFHYLVNEKDINRDSSYYNKIKSLKKDDRLRKLLNIK